MKIAATIARSLKRDLEAEASRIAKGAETGVRTAGAGLRDELRRQVVAAGLGFRLARTWRERTYPNQGHDAASLVWSKAPQIVRAFDKGVVIRGRNGLWLAIPTPAAPKRILGRRVTPALLEQAWGIRLRFVYRANAPSLLVADNMRARGGRRGGFAMASESARRSGRGLATAVMFIMVPQLRMPKRLDVARAARRWSRALPQLIDRQMGVE